MKPNSTLSKNAANPLQTNITTVPAHIIHARFFSIVAHRYGISCTSSTSTSLSFSHQPDSVKILTVPVLYSFYLLCLRSPNYLTVEGISPGSSLNCSQIGARVKNRRFFAPNQQPAF
jgi:hypothetical protein